jgi:hypothetical protein
MHEYIIHQVTAQINSNKLRQKHQPTRKEQRTIHPEGQPVRDGCLVVHILKKRTRYPWGCSTNVEQRQKLGTGHLMLVRC